jgi:ribosomal protein S27E
MKRPDFIVLKCQQCGRDTVVFGKTTDGERFCMVCVHDQLMSKHKPQVGPSEVKNAYT